jgi:hypothetical protein
MGPSSTGNLYLLPYGTDARDDVGIKSSGLEIDELRGELLALAKHGRVLVLLDACHSGATTMNEATLAMNSTSLRTALAGANVTVLTSSSGSLVSREDAAWQHGAFTKTLLDAFNDPAADINQPYQPERARRVRHYSCCVTYRRGADPGYGDPERYDLVRDGIWPAISVNPATADSRLDAAISPDQSGPDPRCRTTAFHPEPTYGAGTTCRFYPRAV